MLETGIVSKINKDETALIITTKNNSACGNCKLCTPLSSNEYGVIADNALKAKINDRVIVFIPEKKNTLSIFLFLVPIFLFFAVYVLSQFLFMKFHLHFNELIGAGFGTAADILYFLIFSRIYQSAVKKQSMARITKILPPLVL